MARFTLLLVLMSSVLVVNAYAQQNFYFHEEWENAEGVDSDIWSVEGVNPDYTILETSNVIYHSGSRALKAELYNPDKLYKRAEVAHRYKAQMGQQYFYRFSIFMPTTGYPANHADGSTFELIAQWHAYPDFSLGETWRSPVLAFYVNEQGDIRISTRTSDLAVNDNSNCLYIVHEDALGNDSFQVPKGQWVTFEVSVCWDSTENGYLDIWMDEQQIVQYEGPTCYNDSVGPYLKLGIYRTTWMTARHTIYYDNIQILKNGLIVFPDRDTYVRGGSYENTNYGSSGLLTVKDNTSPYYLRKSYLHFDYQRFGNYVVTDASLLLNLLRSTTLSFLTAYRTSDSWGEMQLTYANASGLTTYGYQDAADASGEICELNMPDAVSQSEFSLRLTLGVQDALIQFPSRESTTITNRPMLFLEW